MNAFKILLILVFFTVLLNMKLELVWKSPKFNGWFWPEMYGIVYGNPPRCISNETFHGLLFIPSDIAFSVELAYASSEKN